MRFGRSNIPDEASFDLTPMVDVVMLLIIFFTLTTHFAATQLLPMDLPREKGEQADEEQKGALTVDLRKDGTMAVLGSEVGMTELLELVQAENSRNGGNVQLVVRADRTGRAEHLSQLAGALAGAGVREWKLATSAEGGL